MFLSKGFSFLKSGGFKMLNKEKNNGNLTTLDRLKIAIALLDSIDCKSNNLDDLLFYTFLTENYIKGMTHLIKEVSELPVVD